jgi:hypothetical protein
MIRLRVGGGCCSRESMEELGNWLTILRRSGSRCNEPKISCSTKNGYEDGCERERRAALLSLADVLLSLERYLAKTARKQNFR